MSSGKFAELSAGTCLHCGLRTLAPVCPRCETETSIAGPRPVAVGAVRVGYVGRGGSASPTVWITTENDSTLYTASGRVIVAETSNPKGLARLAKRFVNVDGVASLECEVAAGLVACERQLVEGIAASSLCSTLIEHRLGGADGIAGTRPDLARARRTACELAGVGCRASIALLPLSPSEIQWWSALAALRSAERDEVVAHLGDLPNSGYDVAAVILRWAADRWVGDAAAKAKFLVERRLQGTPSQRLTKVSLACGSSPLEQFLLDPSVADSSSLDGRRDASPSVARALALAGHSIDGQLQVGAIVSSATLDDLIDLNVPLDPTSLSDDQRRQVLARTRPEALTDAEVAMLHLEFERDRRAVLAGAYDSIDVAHADPHVRAVVRLQSDSTVSAELRAIDPALCDQLAAFLQKPSMATLTVDLVRDPSLWTLLARRLDVPVASWPADPGSPKQPFVGWIALRATFARLTAGDWQAAADVGEHALRLAADESQRREAANAVAFALWQQGDRMSAATALRSVSAAAITRGSIAAAHVEAPEIALAVNHTLIAASADDDTAAAELARMIDIGGTSEIAAAAVMAAIRRWSVEELPWSARPRRFAEPLVVALRNFAVRSDDLAVVRALLRHLSNVDREWVARPANLTQSTIRSTTDVRIFHARATGPREYVDALTYALRSSNPPAWLLAERDQAVAIAVRRVFDDDGSSALFALFSVERAMPVSSDQRASLSTLAVLAACAQADPADAPLDESFRRLLVDAEVYFRDAPASLHQRHLLAAAWEQLAVHHAAHFGRLVAKMQRSSENIVEQASREGRRRNGQLAELAMEPILHDASVVGDSIAEFRAHVTSSPVAAELDAMSAALDEVRSRAVQLRRRLE